MIYQWQRNLHASVQGNLLQGCKPLRAMCKSYVGNHAAVFLWYPLCKMRKLKLFQHQSDPLPVTASATPSS